jgi:hypothetical protein
LGCTAAGFPAYEGDADMFRVHKFMVITKEQNDFFISQVGGAASALGVSDEDVATIATVLDTVFNTRCPPLLTSSDGVPSFLVGTNPSVCSADSCPLAPGGTCEVATTPAPVSAPAPAPTAPSENVTICSKYTSALFEDDTGDNQLALLMAVVDLAVSGNATLNVPGILAPEGGLAGFFNGAGPTTNRGDMAVTINFVDGSENTSKLFAHLYQFFGALLGCTAAGFPAYEGVPDMFSVHKFMRITQEQNDFFIKQVGLAASALGVTDNDVMTIGTVLDTVFNTRCPPLLTASDKVPSFLVGTNPSICSADSCPLAPGCICKGDAPVKAPTANVSSGSTGGMGGAMTALGFAFVSLWFGLI